LVNLKGFKIHDFRNSLLLVFCTMSLVQADKALAADEPRRTLFGYSIKLSVGARDTVDFKVNVTGGGRYEADLVRVINGESQSIYGAQFKVEYTAKGIGWALMLDPEMQSEFVVGDGKGARIC